MSLSCCYTRWKIGLVDWCTFVQFFHCLDDSEFGSGQWIKYAYLHGCWCMLVMHLNSLTSHDFRMAAKLLLLLKSLWANVLLWIACLYAESILRFYEMMHWCGQPTCVQNLCLHFVRILLSSLLFPWRSDPVDKSCACLWSTMSGACLCSYPMHVYVVICLINLYLVGLSGEYNMVEWLFAWSYHHLGDWFEFLRKFNCSAIKLHCENFNFQVDVRSYTGKTHIYLYLNFIGLFNYVYYKIGDGKTFGFECVFCS